MTGILSLTTYLPLLGVAAILLLRAIGGGEEAKANSAANWIALATTLATLALSVILVASFDRTQSGFQFSEDAVWFSGLHYHMGVDGISVLFVLLTAFLMPIMARIAASIRTEPSRV